MEGHLSEKTCRTCLQESDELTSLYAKDDNAGPTLLEKLRFCASIEVLVSEFKPSNACPQCVRCIAEYYDFKRRCELSEKTLEDLYHKLSEYTIKKNEVILKEEGDVDDKKECIDAIDDVDDRVEEDINSTVDAKTESDDFNWLCEDDSNWEPCFDKVVNDDRGFKCEICKKSFKTKDTLLRHIRWKIMQRRRCDGCGKLYDTLTAMLRHRAGAHPRLDPYEKGEKNQLKCMVCEKTFDVRVDLNQHLMSHAMEYGFNCGACGELFDTQSQLETHEQDYVCTESDGKEKRKISCDQCDKKLMPSAFEKHRAGHIDDRNLECHVCKYSFKVKYDLRRHIREHLIEKRRCDGCDKLFDSLSEMLAHRANVHPHLDPYVDKGIEHLRCELCKKTFDCNADLFSHSNVHLSKCYKCGERFETTLQMQTHTCDCQEPELSCNDADSGQMTNNPEQEKSSNPDLAQDDGKEKNKTLSHPGDHKEELRCNICSRFYLTAKALRRHRWNVHLKPRKRCDKCGASFQEESYLRIHMEIHNDQRTKFVCDTCGKAYNFESSLQHHIADHHADRARRDKKVYKCKLCPKQYNVMGSLTSHMLLHKQQRSDYKCHLCEKRFDFELPFKNHLRRHNKQHSCDICDRRFDTPKKLERHKSCHAREAVKPYGCKSCAKRFSTAGNLWKHTKTFHNGKKNIKCDVCGAEFYNRPHYVAHYSGHTGVKPHQCDICGKGYNYIQYLVRHRKQCVPQKEEILMKEAKVASTS